MDDVQNVTFFMDSYKALNVDEFQPIFFKTYWDVVVNDIYNMVAFSFASGSFDPCLAETLIVPIPKVDDP